MELKEPKRKRSAGKIPQLQTLPVLIESISGITACNSLWPVYVGTFSGDSVIVSAVDEMTALYKMGFFGKGCFSRGYPAFGDTRKGVRFIRERQWKRRKLWIDQLLSFSDSTNVENIDDLVNSKDIHNKQSTSKDSNSDVEEIEIIDTDDTITNQCGSKSREPSNSASSNGLQKEVKGKQSVKHVTDSKCNKRQNEISGFSDVDVCSLEVTDNCSNKSSHNSSTNKSSKFDSSTVSDLEKRSTQVTEHNELDHDNSVLIIDDSDSDGESRLQSPRPRLCEESIKTAVETLNLTLEEAFFLSFGLGCLQVVDLQGIFLSLRGMWHLYNESQPNFISSYVTYHYFRSKGWIVKPGTKFGGNFLLYKQGPPFYHASYIVLIEEVNNKINESREKKQLTWTKVLGLTRIAESAGKEILISQVQWPSDITEEDLNNPKIISKFKVQEVLFRRWNSGHEREEKE